MTAKRVLPPHPTPAGCSPSRHHTIGGRQIIHFQSPHSPVRVVTAVPPIAVVRGTLSGKAPVGWLVAVGCLPHSTAARITSQSNGRQQRQAAEVVTMVVAFVGNHHGHIGSGVIGSARGHLGGGGHLRKPRHCKRRFRHRLHQLCPHLGMWRPPPRRAGPKSARVDGGGGLSAPVDQRSRHKQGRGWRPNAPPKTA